MTNGPLIVDGILANFSQDDSIAEHNIPQKNLDLLCGVDEAPFPHQLSTAGHSVAAEIFDISFFQLKQPSVKKDPSLRCQDEHKIA